MSGDSFREFVLDQLTELGNIVCRAMFGGHGLYCGEVFFGILHKDRLYFKTDAATRPAYEAQGMQPFRPSAQQTLKNYYEVPADVLDDPDTLTLWARRAVSVASARPAGKRRRR